MIPKDKAYQLVTRFYLALPNNGSQTGINNVHQRWEEGKKCAAMAVDEMTATLYDNDLMQMWDYWKEVKQEIENID
jgi:hypothetical protein